MSPGRETLDSPEQRGEENELRIVYVLAEGDHGAACCARVMAASAAGMGVEFDILEVSRMTWLKTGISGPFRQRLQGYDLLLVGNSWMAFWLRKTGAGMVLLLAQEAGQDWVRFWGVEVIRLDWFHFGLPVLPPILDTAEPDSVPQQEIGLLLPSVPLDQVIAAYSCRSQPLTGCHPAIAEPQVNGSLTLLPWQRWPHLLAGSHAVLSDGLLNVVASALAGGTGLWLLARSRHCHAPLLAELELARLVEGLGVPLPTAAREPALRVRYPRTATALMHWLAGGQPIPLMELCRQLWRQVLFAEPLDERLRELGGESGIQCGGLLR